MNIMDDSKITFIAEIGLNHNGSMDLAKEHIEKAKESGASVAKFQTYFTDSRAKNNSPIYSILEQCELNADQFYELAEFCKNIDIKFASTPFCINSFKILNELNCSFIKIASFHLNNHILLRHIFENSKIKELIISTGVSSFKDILNANKFYDDFKRLDKPNLTFMHCISEYPISNLKNLNLINIREIGDQTKKNVGFSDHSKGSLAPSLAISLGARVIEKHFTIDNSLEGADHSMSANPKEFAGMVEKCFQTLEVLGQKRDENNYFECENNAKQFCVKSS